MNFNFLICKFEKTHVDLKATSYSIGITRQARRYHTKFQFHIYKEQFNKCRQNNINTYFPSPSKIMHIGNFYLANCLVFYFFIFFTVKSYKMLKKYIIAHKKFLVPWPGFLEPVPYGGCLVQSWCSREGFGLTST